MMEVISQQHSVDEDHREITGNSHYERSRLTELKDLPVPKHIPSNSTSTVDQTLQQSKIKSPQQQTARLFTTQPTELAPESNISTTTQSSEISNAAASSALTCDTDTNTGTIDEIPTASSTVLSTSSSILTQDVVSTKPYPNFPVLTQTEPSSSAFSPDRLKPPENISIHKQERFSCHLINGYEAIKLDKTHSALPTMPVPEEYQRTWHNQIRERLEDELALKLQLESHLEFLMVSDSRGRICPCILITCWDDDVTERLAETAAMSRRLQKQILKYQSLQNCPFPCKVVMDKISLAAKQERLRDEMVPEISLHNQQESERDNLNDTLNLNSGHRDIRSLVGVSIHGSKSSEIYCVLSGLITVENMVYGLTVAHPFAPRVTAHRSQDFNGSDSSETSELNDSGDDDNLFDDYASVESNIFKGTKQTSQQDRQLSSKTASFLPSENFQRERSTGRDVFIAESTQRLGNICVTSNESTRSQNHITINLDWALIELDQSISTQSNTYQSPHTSSDIQLSGLYEGELFPGLRVSVIIDGRDHSETVVGQCNLRLTIDGMHLLVCQLVLKTPLAQGISGSWVVKDDLIVGCLVAVRSSMPLAYMIPMKNIVSDIKTCCGADDVSFIIFGRDRSTTSFRSFLSRANRRRTFQENDSDIAQNNSSIPDTQVGSNNDGKSNSEPAREDIDPDSCKNPRPQPHSTNRSFETDPVSKHNHLENEESPLQDSELYSDLHDVIQSAMISERPIKSRSLFSFRFLLEKISGKMAWAKNYFSSKVQTHEGAILDPNDTDWLRCLELTSDTNKSDHASLPANKKSGSSTLRGIGLGLGHGLAGCLIAQLAVRQEDRNGTVRIFPSPWNDHKLSSDLLYKLAQESNKIVAASRFLDPNSDDAQLLEQGPKLQPFHDSQNESNKPSGESEVSYFFPLDSKPSTWKPFVLQPMYKLLLVTIALILAVGQELLLKLSFNGYRVQVFDYMLFMGKTILTVLLMSLGYLYSIMDLKVRRLEPYYQLAQSRGTMADRSLNLDYLTMSHYLIPIQSAFQGHWAVSLSSTCNILASVVAPALQIPSIILHSRYKCRKTAPQECPDSETFVPLRVRPLLFHLSVVCYVMIIIMTLLLHIPSKRKSGLLHEPEGIASLVSMSTRSKILESFRNFEHEQQRSLNRALKNRRFVLFESSIWQGELCLENDTVQGCLRTSKQPQPMVLRWYVGGLFVAYVCICTATTLVVLFKPKTPIFMLPLLMVIIIKPAWATLENTIRLLEPYHNLSHGDCPVEKSLTLDYLSTNHNHFLFSAARNGNMIVLLSGITTIALEALTFILTLVSTGDLLPKPSEIQLSGRAMTTFTIIYLLIMLPFVLVTITIFLVYACRSRPFLPQFPSTIASVLTYIYASNLLEDFMNTERLTPERLQRHLKTKQKTYGLAWFRGVDGQVRCAIDQEPMRSKYVYGQRYHQSLGPRSWDEREEF